jgi:hypothetical protein
MALVNPQIAMSYRPTVEYQPRNALAEYAQVQQIMGGQRQAEMADMQMRRMQQEDAEIERIHQIAMKQGGPETRMEMGRALFASRNPQQRELGYKILQHEEAKIAFNAAERQFGYSPAATGSAAPSAAAEAAGVAAAPSAPAAAPNATARAVFSQDAIADVNPEAQKNISSILGDAAQLRAQANEFKGSARASGFLSQAEQLENQAASMLAVQKRRASGSRFDTGAPATDEEFGAARQALAVGQAPPVNTIAAANALAPAAAPVTNAMVAQPAMPPAGVNQLASAGSAPGGAALTGLGGKTLAQLQNEFRTYSRLDQQGAPGAKGRLEEIKREIDFIYKTNEPGAEQNMMRALGLPITEAGFAKFQRLKDSPSELTKLLDKLDLPPAQRRDFELRMAQKLVSHAPATTVNVSTEKRYGERFGGLIAEQDAGKRAAAEKSSQLATSANRIIGLVQQGNVFTGPIADVKLNIARALNVAGASNQEKIANTENLIAATGQSTLDAIKGAGLGTGQGFTNKDLEFLRGIAGGTINLTPQTLTELARLQHLTATRAAESWNKRVREIPREVIQGTGLSTTPITVPPLTEIKRSEAVRPAGVGDNWTLERDAAGNTAWVSPDRKSFKEVR